LGDPGLSLVHRPGCVRGTFGADDLPALRGTIGAPELAAPSSVLIIEDDRGELNEGTEREREARIIEADRGESFVDASEVLRRLDARRTKS
jgi:hypothetical protein